LEVSGYFGDMDETFSIEQPYDREIAEKVYLLWKRIRDEDDLRERTQIYKGDDDSILDEIPADQGYEQLPTVVESLSLTWYDGFGTPFNVEVS